VGCALLSHDRETVLGDVVRFVAFACIVACFTQSALAIPGQTVNQLAGWGRSNPALHGFHSVYDAHAGRNTYVAKVALEGFHATFSSMPVNNDVPHEQTAFSDMPSNYELNRSWKFNARVLAHIYGPAVGEDALHPVAGFGVGNVAVRQGKLYAYAALRHTILVYRRSLYQHVALQARACHNVECGGI
jgi:hypothetical protein